MAESKGALLAKSVTKHAGRAKEKLLQNLGKVDRTADEIFDDHLTNFSRQQGSANKLQKEFNNYIRCVRAAQLASKSLMDAVCEVYEPQWSGYDALLAQANATESLWQDFSHKLGDQVLIPLNTYTAQFPEMKKKVEKRNRKLIDYDSQRHSFQNLQANASKRKDDVKVSKGREQLEEARRTYEILNTELHDELPALFDSRILFLVTNLQTLFASEQVFHVETSKIYSELEAIVDKLATDSQRGSYTLKKSTATPIKNSGQISPKIINNSNYTNQITNGSTNANSPSPTTSSPSSQTEHSPKFDNTPTRTPSTPSSTSPQLHNDLINNKNTDDNNDNEPSYQNTASIIAAATAAAAAASTTPLTTSPTSNNKQQTPDNEMMNGKKLDNLNSPNANTTPAAAIITTTTTTTSEIKTIQSNNKIEKQPSPPQVNGNVEKSDMKKVVTSVLDATTTDLPPGVLYRVKATYAYVKEDGDELSFEVGDIIRVIEYDDPEDQEEGWLMGEKEGTTEKGLFPANFTRPI